MFATRGTLESAKFRALHEALRGEAQFVLQPCDGLAAAIEGDRGADVASLCLRHARAAGEFGTAPGQIDTLVLGCTHYPFALRALREAVGPGVQLVDTGEAVARQARRLLEAHALLGDEGDAQVDFLTTGSPAALRQAAQRWLGL